MKTSASPEERADTAQAEDQAALREMVEKAKAGDQSAFAGLYEMYSLEVYRTLRSMVRNEDLIQDLQQDVFLTAFSSLSQLQNSERILPWLRKIAVNKVKDEYKRKKPLLFSELYTDETEVPEFPETSISVLPEDALDQKETADLVRDILKTLTEEQQLVIGMHYYEGIPVKDIAKTLGVSEGSVSARLNRGRARVEKEVRQLESKGIKLYGLQPMPFLVALLRRWMLPESKREAAKAVVLENAGLGTAAVTAKTAGTLLGAVVVKLLIGAAILLLFGGGAAVIYGIGRGRNRPEPQPVSVETMSSPTDMTDLEAVLASEDPNPTDRPSDPETEPQTEPSDPNESDDPNEPDQPDEPSEPDLPEAPSEVNQPDEPSNPSEPQVPDQPPEPVPSGVPVPSPEPDPPQPSESEPDPEPEPSSEDENKPNAYSGDFGNLSWQYDTSTGVLRISGNGDMGDDPPWNQWTKGGNLTTVIVEEGVTSIGSNFITCGHDFTLSLPQSLREIYAEAFQGCGLTRISIPSNVDYIETGALDGSAIAQISISAGNDYYTAQDNVIYNASMSELVMCAPKRTGSLTIPSGVEKIHRNAFKACALDSVTVPAGMTELSGKAFADSNIKTVLLPSGLKSIGDSVFIRCGIESITIPDGVTTLGSSVFYGCKNLREVHIPSSVNVTGVELFTQCENAVIYGPENSFARSIAIEYNLPYVEE